MYRCGQSQLLYRRHDSAKEASSESTSAYMSAVHCEFGAETESSRILQKGNCAGTKLLSYLLSSSSNSFVNYVLKINNNVLLLVDVFWKMGIFNKNYLFLVLFQSDLVLKFPNF